MGVKSFVLSFCLTYSVKTLNKKRLGKPFVSYIHLVASYLQTFLNDAKIINWQNTMPRTKKMIVGCKALQTMVI
jgi:hypothetical protein